MAGVTYPELPTYRGLPVPFVARRSGESPEDGVWKGFGIRMAFDVLTGGTYPVLVNDDLYRDEEGWLWQPSPQNLDGKPEFAQVNVERQRLCMDEALCQVCGRSAVHQGEGSWLISPDDLPSDPSREVVAQQPPVCVRCVAVSQEKCPHLRRTPWTHVLARETRRYGVVGDVYNAGGEIVHHGWMTHRTKEAAAMTLARQRLIALTDWRLA